MENLTFISTLGIQDFKSHQGISAIQVIRNPNTSKLFFTAGSITGAVSSKLDKDRPDSIVISKVKGSDEEEFYLLHNRSEDNVEFSL